jgi:hypothetical protein
MAETNTEEIDLLHKTKLVVCSNCGAETNLHPVEDVFLPKLTDDGTVNHHLIMDLLSKRKLDIKMFTQNIQAARESGRGKNRKVVLEVCVDVDTGQEIMRQFVHRQETLLLIFYAIPWADYESIKREIKHSL